MRAAAAQGGDTTGVIAPAGTIAPDRPDLKTAMPVFHAARQDFEAARPDLEPGQARL